MSASGKRPSGKMRSDETQLARRDQEDLLTALEGLLELPMVVLSLLMIAAFVVEVAVPLSPPAARALNLLAWFIWAAFVLEFGLKIAIAPDKAAFLRRNWLMVLALLLPALRVLRIARAARALRSLGALRVITLGNRTLRKLDILFVRRRLQYVLAVVTAITLLSAAGTYSLERGVPGATITTFGDALWFAAGIITTVGTELYPVTGEARLLAVLAMVFGVSVFGYLAGSLASLFVSSDRSDATTEDPRLAALTHELHALRHQLSDRGNEEAP